MDTHRLEHVPQEVTVLPEDLQELEDLGLPLAVLVRGVGVHDVVEGASSSGSHGAGGAGGGGVGRIQVQELVGAVWSVEC